MRDHLIRAFLSLAIFGSSSAAAAINEPKLPINDVNIVVLTDVHSWVAGHGRQEPKLDADYGDVLSFYERLKSYLDEKEKDLWLVSNGDFVHGTGLSAPGDPSSLIPIIERMPWDAVNCGNHELYEESIVEYMIRPGGLVDWLGERYITSNICVRRDGRVTLPESSLGHTFRVLKGKNANILVFGFLYNMKDACSLIEVMEVDRVVKSSWFKDALTTSDYNVDGILVLAHMDLKDSLVEVIRKAIRQIVGETMPIQFITGHTHYRGVLELDNMSTSFEAGRYLDTVGFVSFPKQSKVDDSYNQTSALKHVFLNASKENLGMALGINRINEMTTDNGRELSEFIYTTRANMGLTKTLGCAPHHYSVSAPLTKENSMWRLFRDQVIPNTFARDHPNSIMFLQDEAWRYDLFSTSPLIVDDIKAVAPFNDMLVHIGSVPGSAILQLNMTMNVIKDVVYHDRLPNYILIGEIDDTEKEFELYTHDFNLRAVIKGLTKILPNKEFEPKNTQISSTSYWIEFIEKEWVCKSPSSPKKRNLVEGSKKDIIKTTAILLSMVLLMILVLFSTNDCLGRRGMSQEQSKVDEETVIQDEEEI